MLETSYIRFSNWHYKNSIYLTITKDYSLTNLGYAQNIPKISIRSDLYLSVFRTNKMLIIMFEFYKYHSQIFFLLQTISLLKTITTKMCMMVSLSFLLNLAYKVLTQQSSLMAKLPPERPILWWVPNIPQVSSNWL